MPEQTSESLTDHDSTRLRSQSTAQQHISNPLMGSLRVVVLHELPHEMIEMPLSKHHEMVQALLLDRLNESFDERLAVGQSGDGQT